MIRTKVLTSITGDLTQQTG